MDVKPSVSSSATRLLATAGIGDMVKNIVNSIHHAIRVGKGDENVGISLPSSKGKHVKSDEKQDADDQKQLLKLQKKMAKKTQKGATGPTASTPSQLAPQQPQPKPARPKTQPAATRPTSKSSAPKTTPSQPKPTPSNPHNNPAPKPPGPPMNAQPQHVNPPPQPKVKKPKGGNGALRAAKPSDSVGPDPNSTHGARERTASKDIEVKGTINGRNMTTTISAGQTYHLKEDDGKTQLVMPGLFGRFLVNPEYVPALRGP